MEQPRVRVMGIGLELRGLKKDGTDFAADIDLGPLEIDNEFLVLAAPVSEHGTSFVGMVRSRMYVNSETETFG